MTDKYEVNYIKIELNGILEGLPFKHSFIIETKMMRRTLRTINKKFNYNFKWRKLKRRGKEKEGAAEDD
jgi:predicted AAA+ superfamily ATPase